MEHNCVLLLAKHPIHVVQTYTSAVPCWRLTTYADDLTCRHFYEFLWGKNAPCCIKQGFFYSIFCSIDWWYTISHPLWYMHLPTTQR
jgi:hypothetical protein